MSACGMYIQATGMCCAVGYSTVAASAAMGACIDHFRDSWFQTRKGSPVRCAMVWGLDEWGPERMGKLFASVLDECQEQLPFNPGQTALLLLVPDPERPGVDGDWPLDIYDFCVKQLAFHPSSRICPWDRAGLGPTLHHARNLLSAGTVDHVLLAGVDSYLNVTTINACLDQDRVLVEDVSDGFIPGEGAGAVVLGLEAPQTAAVRICGTGTGFEEAHILQDTLPNRANGLVQAIREAVAESGKPLTDIQFHLSDASGNLYYASERAVALLRTLEHRVETIPYLLPATCFGETGAAAGPLMLAYLTRYMPRESFTYGLVHCSADNGYRCAVLAAYA